MRQGLCGGASALGGNGVEECDGAHGVEAVRPGRVAEDMVIWHHWVSRQDHSSLKKKKSH